MKSVSLKIDGQQVTAPADTTVLQAARSAGIYVPTLCHDDDLEPYGACRLCIVEIDGMRGLPTACTTKVADGMVVRTDTENVNKVRRMVCELLIADHPGDCLSCSSNQHCELQKVASYLGMAMQRLDKMRRTAIMDTSNPFFVRDMSKCVLCGRCVRTCEELRGLGAITLAGRGFESRITTCGDLPVAESICESCGECVARCPVGALAVKDESRHFTSEVRSICPYCGVGCGFVLGVRGERIVSVRGESGSPVNRGRLCVKGRFGLGFVSSAERLTKPLIKRNGIFEEATWDEALDLVVSKFKQYHGDQFAAIGSSRATNEDCYVVQKFARAVMGTNNVDNCARLCHAPTVSGLSKAFGTGGGTNPLADIPGAACIFVIGSNPTEAHPVAGVQIRNAAKNAKLIVADPREIGLAQCADIWLQQRPGTDVPLLMGMARVIVDEGLHDSKFIADRCDNFEEFKKSLEQFDLDTVETITRVPKEQIIKAARLYAGTKPALIVYSLGITEHSHGTDNVLAIANLAMLTGNVGKISGGVMPMRGQNNVQGACDMGCIPNAYQGYQLVANPEVKAKFEKAWGYPLSDKPGLTLVEQFNATLEGKIKAYYVVGMDIAYSVADATRVQEALRKAEFIVFQDIFLTGSAKFADVILPATTFAEKDGTFTNLERRVQRVRKCIAPVGDSRPDWWITCEIARRMGGKGFDYKDPSEIMDEIARLTPSFAGISFKKLDDGGIQWPCTAPDHSGTPRLHVEKFNLPSGKGHFTPLQYRPSAEATDNEYPFLLMTGRSLYHFHLAMTTQVPGLMALYPEEMISVHPDDAVRLGIADGEIVRVSSRRGALDVKARITKMVKPGEAFMTFHFYESPTNVLTIQALDPASKTPEFKVTAVNIEKLPTNPAAKKPRK
jgi:formate dehydrogenase (NADP+) alpha subunit